MTKLLTSKFTHLQFLGPMGSGKTTTLLQLADNLAQKGFHVAYEYLALGERNYKTETTTLDILLLDEAQRLNWQSRRRLLASLSQGRQGSLRLILSSHKDLTGAFRRRGLPLQTVVVDEVLTAAFYGRILARRLAYFALPGRPHTTLSADAVQWLYETFYPNMRDAEYFLYEVWQRETAVREITAVHLKNLFAKIG
ncbi:MAG: hypothetical protein P8183_00315 [Anaerolineae bacterium]